MCVCCGIWGGRCKNHYSALASAGCFLSTHNHLLNRSSQGPLVFYLAYFGWLQAGGGHLSKHNRKMGNIFSVSQSIQKKGQLNWWCKKLQEVNNPLIPWCCLILLEESLITHQDVIKCFQNSTLSPLYCFSKLWVVVRQACIVIFGPGEANKSV